MAKKSKKKKSFQQELREKQPKPEISSGSKQVVFKDDLDPKTRRGFILMSYLLFFVGSLGCIIVGYAGRDKRGSSEVIIIGWISFISHVLILSLYLLNVNPSNGIPLIVPFVALAIIPLGCIIAGLASRKSAWAVCVKTIGMILIIPQFMILGYAASKITWDETGRKEIQVKNNIRRIYNTLESYAYENEKHYPENIQMLIDEKYLKEFPVNALSEANGQMQNVEFGSSGIDGNFTYFPVIEKGEVISCYLIGYGANRDSSSNAKSPYLDVDGDGSHDNVLIVLGGSSGGLTSILSLKSLL
ncbi:hypothetical protein KKB99_01180 [bacterium]|nr:hypothetical protein [bacterium]MBU1024599.1 hypothetical protein [bacterium]